MAKLDHKIFIGIIKHELCHYHLHIENKGFQHKDADFKELLTKTGGLRYAPDIRTKQSFHVYKCQNCQLTITRQKKELIHNALFVVNAVVNCYINIPIQKKSENKNLLLFFLSFIR